MVPRYFQELLSRKLHNMEPSTILALLNIVVMIFGGGIVYGKLANKVDNLEAGRENFENHITAKLLSELEDKYYAPIKIHEKRIKDLENRMDGLQDIIKILQNNFGKVLDAMRTRRGQR